MPDGCPEVARFRGREIGVGKIRGDRWVSGAILAECGALVARAKVTRRGAAPVQSSRSTTWALV